MVDYVETMDLVINDLDETAALAEALKWWSVMNGGTVNDSVSDQLSPQVLAHPKYVAAAGGVDAHFEFYFSDAPVEVAGAYSTKAEMDADLVPADGILVNCFDPDPAKRGRYAKSGATGAGSWSLASADIEDKAWTDYNHPQRLLELLICSFVKTSTPVPIMGSQQGWDGPDDGDFRGCRVTLDMEWSEVRIGPFTKVGLHAQGNEPNRSAALTAAYGEGDKYFFPNFIETKDLISDQMDFGHDSWGLDNKVPVVRAAHRREVTIDLSADDDDWHCFGDPGRDPTGRALNYGEAPVGEILQNLVGNMFVLSHTFAPTTDANWWVKSSAESVPEADRFRGTIRLFGVKIEAPV